MNDDELEEWLARYRPVGPQPASPSPIIRPSRGPVIADSAWMPATAALMAAAAFYWLSAHERAAVHLNVDHAAVARAASVGLVSRSLGGGPQSLLVAEFVVSLDEPKALD